MNTTDTLPHIEIEDFHFTINTSSSTVSIKDLLSYLSNYESMVTSVNHVLNKNGCIGFDQVIVEIEAFQHGSFDIVGRMKKISQNPTFSAVGAAVIGVLLTKALCSDPSPTIIVNNGGTVEIKYDDLIDNRGIVKSRSGIARTATGDPNVESLTFSFGQEGSAVSSRQINLSTLRSIIVDESEDDGKEVKTNTCRTRLRIVGPVLESEPANWKVIMEDRKLSAYMADESFLKLMDEKKIAFGKGDVIIADLETEVVEEEGKRTRVKHFIRKVHEYPQYTIDESKQMSIPFDNKTDQR